jgi:FtsZ-interacting cell division protein YlmF
MSSLFSKALVYLGLVDEDQSDPDAGYDTEAATPLGAARGGQIVPEGRRIEPPPVATRAAAPRYEPGQSVAGVRPIRSASHADVLVVEEFGDAKVLADRIRDRVPVVLDFRRVDGELTRRVVDFCSGLIYALDGTMSKVGDGLVLVLPPGGGVDTAEKRRLAALGAYELPID